MQETLVGHVPDAHEDMNGSLVRVEDVVDAARTPFITSR